MAETQQQPIFAVLVTNISPNANEKTVSDFFSFCGKITNLYFDKEEGKDSSKAVVQFQTESASKTALLLTNALIVDRPITVSPYPPKDAPEPQIPILPPGTPVPQEHITHRDFGDIHDEERTKTSVLASLLASGYELANDALHKAKEVDDEHNISLQLKVGVEVLKVKAHELDQQYKITEKATAVKQQATEKAKKLDEDYKISEKATQVKHQATEKAKKLDEDYKLSEKATQAANTFMATAAKAQENPTVKQGVETVKSGWAAVTQSVTGLYSEYKEQTLRAIEEKKKEKAQSQPHVQDLQHSVEDPQHSVQDPQHSVHDLQQPAESNEDASLPPQTVPTEQDK